MEDARQRAQRGLTTLQNRSTRILDNYIPPSRRNDLSNQLQTWAAEHPKLATLLALHLTLSLPPIVLFTLFALSTTLTTLTIALTTAITLALLTTLTILTLTFFLLLLPTLLLTTTIATALFALAILTSTTTYFFSTTSQPQIVSLRSSAFQTADKASERVKSATDGRFDPTSASKQFNNTIGSPAIEGLAIYNKELAKMRNGNTHNQPTEVTGVTSARSSGSSGKGEGGKGTMTPRASSGPAQVEIEEGGSERERAGLARQALGIPAE